MTPKLDTRVVAVSRDGIGLWFVAPPRVLRASKRLW